MTSNSNFELNNDGCSEDAAGILLPAEVWASVFEHLPYETILSCAASCRTFLHDAIPLLKTLHIDKSAQMNLTVASRFRDIREIRINSLMCQDHTTGNRIEVDLETTLRLVPFLSKFCHLERVSFGGHTRDGRIVERFVPFSGYFRSGGDGGEDGDMERMFTAIDTISAAYRVGSLPEKLEISGLCCPLSKQRQYWGNDRNSDCERCLRACQSMPLESVVRFHCRGYSVSKAKLGMPYGMDVCLSRAQLEFCIETRPGGSDLLRSKERILRLLGKGTSYTVGTGNEETFHVVKFKQVDLAEMKRVKEDLKLDMNQLLPQEVTDALMESFVDESRQVPLQNCRYISESSFDFLAKELELPISPCAFNCPLENMFEKLPQIAKVLTRQESFCFRNIEVDCLKLVRQLLELDNDSYTQKIVSLLARTLVGFLEYCPEHRMEAGASLKVILEKGTTEQRKQVMDAGILMHLRQLLHHSARSIIELALSVLVKAVGNASIQNIKDFLRPQRYFSVLQKLISLFDSGHESNVRDSLKVLILLSKGGHIEDATKLTMLPSIIRLTKSKTETCMLADCLVLLELTLVDPDYDPTKVDPTKVLGGILRYPSHSHMQVVSLLTEIMKSTKQPDVQDRLEGAVLALSMRIVNQEADALVEAGFVPILTNLFTASDMSTSTNAILTLGNILVLTTPKNREIAMQEGVIGSLFTVLEDSEHTSLLKISLRILLKCCVCNVHNYTVEHGLGIFTRLLANDDEEVLTNTCLVLLKLMEELDNEELHQEVASKVIDSEVVQSLLELLAKDSLEVQAAVMKTVYRIISMGDSCVESIFDRNFFSFIHGLLPKTSVKIHEVFGSMCGVIANLIAGSKERVQKAIDCGIITSVLQDFDGQQFRVQNHVLRVIYQATMVGDSEQIQYLVSKGCISYFCYSLREDYKVALLSAKALKEVLTVAKEGCTDGDVNEMFESQLQKYMDESLQLEREDGRLQLLQKKKAWVIYNRQNDRVQSISDAYELLKQQSSEVQQLVKTFEQKIATKSALKQAGAVLKHQHKALVDQQNAQLSSLEKELDDATVKLKRLLRDAERVAPMEKWCERLDKDDLPSELSGLESAISETSAVMKTIEMNRRNWQRYSELDTLSSGFEGLFASAKKRKVDVMEGETEDGSINGSAGDGVSNNKPTPKRKKQASIANYFGTGANSE